MQWPVTVTFLIFISGKVVVTGAKNQGEVCQLMYIPDKRK